MKWKSEGVVDGKYIASKCKIV